MSKDKDWISRAQQEAYFQITTKQQLEEATATEASRRDSETLHEVEKRVTEASELLKTFSDQIKPLLTQLKKAGYKVTLTQRDSVRNSQGSFVSDLTYFSQDELNLAAKRFNTELPYSAEKGKVIKSGVYSSPYVDMNRRDESDPDSSNSYFSWESPLAEVSVKKYRDVAEVTLNLVVANLSSTEFEISHIRQAKAGPMGSGSPGHIEVDKVRSTDLGLHIVMTISNNGAHILSLDEKGVKRVQDLLESMVYEIEKKHLDQQSKSSNPSLDFVKFIITDSLLKLVGVQRRK